MKITQKVRVKDYVIDPYVIVCESIHMKSEGLILALLSMAKFAPSTKLVDQFAEASINETKCVEHP